MSIESIQRTKPRQNGPVQGVVVAASPVELWRRRVSEVRMQIYNSEHRKSALSIQSNQYILTRG